MNTNKEKLTNELLIAMRKQLATVHQHKSAIHELEVLVKLSKVYQIVHFELPVGMKDDTTSHDSLVKAFEDVLNK